MSAPLVAIRAARHIIDAILLVLIGLAFATVVLARVVPAVTGTTTFVVRGDSMQPTMPLGAVVLASPVSSTDLRVGDIVSVQVGPGKAVFTHRIVRLVPRSDGLWIQTRGDANPTPDPSIVPATAVIGRATAWIPIAGYLIAELSSPLGIALVVSTSASLLAAAWFLESLEEARRVGTVQPVAEGAHVPDPLVGRKTAT